VRGGDGVRADSPIADALLALKHAVVHTPHSGGGGGGTSWMSPTPAATQQLPYPAGTHCPPSPSLVGSSYQAPVLSSASPTIYDRGALARSPAFPFSSHHHHHQHHQSQQQQQHRYHGDQEDSSSPALTSASSMYPAAVQRPVYRRDSRDFTFGSAFAHDPPGTVRPSVRHIRSAV